MSEIPSAGGLLERIGRSLGLSPKKAPEAQAAAVAAEAPIAATSPAAGEEAKAQPTPIDVLREAPAFVSTAEASDLPFSSASLLPPVSEEVLITDAQRARDMLGSSGAVMNAAQAEVSAPVPVPVPGGEPQDLDASEVEAMYRQDRKAADVARAESYRAASQAAHAEELPDWLTPPPQPLPVAEEPPAVALPPAETPSPDLPKEFTPDADALYVPGVTPTTAAAEEQALVPVPEAPPPPPVEAREAEAGILESIRAFNWDMEIIRQALEALAAGEALDPEFKKSALIAAATANSMLPKLPPDLLKAVFLMRAVTGKPDFNRNDFQREMLAAVNKIKQGVASKG